MGQLNYQETLNKEYKVFKGNLRIYKSYELLDNEVNIYFSNMKITISYFKDHIVKVFIGEKLEDPISTGAILLDKVLGTIKVIEEKENIIIIGEKVITIVNKFTTEIIFKDLNNNTICEDFQPTFKDEDGCIYITKTNDCIAYYGLGEKGGELNKKGVYTENYNTDDPGTDDNYLMYYKTIPFYVGLKETNCYGLFFDNSFRSYFDMGKSCGDRIFFGAVGGQIQYYFMLGNDIKEVVKQYTYLTGKMDMPPLWSLGYQQNRFSYFSQEEVNELVETFEKKEIPLDVVYLDIDYMDGFRVMTFKTPNFSGAKELIKTLNDKGVRTITILDPGVKIDENYEVYNRGMINNHFTKKLDGEIFIGAVWAGDSVFPDFSNRKCREWWKNELKNFIDNYKIDGIWNDMNEPAVFNNNYKTMLESCIHNSDYGVIEHKEFHNRYGFEMSRCSHEAQKELHPNERGFSMTRATYAGGQRYSSIWTGDNTSKWSQMKMSLCMNFNLGISGFSFIGNDVGGFGLDATEELFIRWMQLGTFLPIFRNHSSMYTRRQEPWSFGSKAEKIVKIAIELRYELLPYIYSLFYISHRDGLPIFRPMIMEYPKDFNLINEREQFMLGSNIIVAPILYPGERFKNVYLPEGNWYDYFTNEKLVGGCRYKFSCELDKVIVLVREGSILPVYLDKFKNVKERPNKITFKIYGEKAEGFYYFDDGYTMDYKSGKYNLLHLSSEGEKIYTKYKNLGSKEEKYEYKFIK